MAEVLITLMILGVIATVTIPALINKWQEKALVSQLKSTYSILSRAYLQAVAENGPADTWDIGSIDTSAGATKLYNYFKPYLRISKECGTGRGCFATHYSALFNSNLAWQPDTHYPYAGKTVLTNGASIMFFSAGTNCPYSELYYRKHCGSINVDINGKNGPNKAGVDYFELLLSPYRMETVPKQVYKEAYQGYGCIYKYTGNNNGRWCASYVLQHGNMDYLRRDVSDDN